MSIMFKLEKFFTLSMKKSRLSRSANYSSQFLRNENFNRNISSQYFSVQLSNNNYYDDMKWSRKILKETSRTFGALFEKLPNELNVATSLFYLILRALDTIEDDENLSHLQKTENMNILLELLQKSLVRLDNYIVSGRNLINSEHDLLKNIHKLLHCIHQLRPEYSKIISETTEKMKFGMEFFLNRPIKTIQDWDLYCHYVAGLVGIGLSKMWIISGLEKKMSCSPQIESLSNSMGLFLQKTNIIRDCHEDYMQNRVFIPENVWVKYVGSYEQMFSQNHAGICVINQLVIDAFRHVEDCLDYLRQIENPHIFKFCAIPQVMAASTLALCYNNSDVLKKNVKISKFEAYKILYSVSNMEVVDEYFKTSLNTMRDKNNDFDSLLNKTKYEQERA